MSIDYRPVVASFLHQITKGGWKISRVIDCESWTHYCNDLTTHSAKKLAKDEILAGEDSTVVFTKPNGKGKNMRVSCLILLGNAPAELVADWSYSSSNADKDFQVYWEKFCEIWDN